MLERLHLPTTRRLYADLALRAEQAGAPGRDKTHFAVAIV
jgi:hypothetical protein